MASKTEISLRPKRWKDRKFPFETDSFETENFPFIPIYSCKKRKFPLETDSFKNRKITLKTEIYRSSAKEDFPLQTVDIDQTLTI